MKPSRTHTDSSAANGRSRRDEGASALEFALVVPILLALVMGIIEFGFLFQTQLALTHGAREGARLAVVGKFDTATVISRTYPVTPTVTTSPSPASATPSGQPITVTLQHDYEWKILPFPGSVPLKGIATMRRE